MINHPFVDWLINSLGSAAVIGFVVYLFRDALLARLSKSVDFKFAKQLEEAKSEIRANERKLEADLKAKERELEKIQEFVGSLRRERSTAVTARRMEAAELALRRCNQIARLSIAAETLKILKIEAVVGRLEDPNLQEYFKTLVTSMKVDELLEELSLQDRALTSLYLNERARAYIEAYEAIILQAVSFMKLMSIGMDPTKMTKLDFVREKVVDLVPLSEEGFREHGNGYAYYWSQYFYDKALSALREIANGEEQDQLDLSAARELAVSAQMTQVEARKKMQELGVPQDLIISQEDVADLPSEAAPSP